MIDIFKNIFNISKKLVNPAYYLIFWGWNLIFIITVYLGLLPYVGIPLVVATFDGDIALDFCLTFFVLIAIPLASCILGGKYFSRQPKQLIRLFYGVEAPLFTWCLIRLFLVRELTLASGFFLGTFLFCVFVFAIELFKLHLPNWNIPSFVKIITHSLVLLMGIYLGLILLFYTTPFAINFLGWFGDAIVHFLSFRWLKGFLNTIANAHYWFSTLMILSFASILFISSSTLFIFMPFVVSSLYVNLGLKTLREFAGQYNQQKVITGAVSVIGVWIILLWSFNQQPQVKAFDLLEKNNLQNRQELLISSNMIRRGLVNANLSAYRYLGTTENNNHIANMYRNIDFNQSVATFLQNLYNQLMSPFIYQGSKEDAKKSSTIYAQLFDTPLQKAERNSVRHAIKSTAIIDEAKAGLLNIDEKKVWLEKQEVTLTPNGDWAEVEIHEIYNNRTPDVEEIFYYFSLPESASITGLWLGESEDLTRRFPFKVSPRGAAQEVYNNQVRRTRPVDPALLEQVGVGQYRLRAFPVPPRLSSDNIRNLEKQPKMHLWLTYKVMKQEQGWALPKLAQKRNIFWDRNTKRIRNGKKQWFFGNAWLEDFWQDKPNLERKSHQVKLNNGYQVAVQPLNQEDYALPKEQKYALILDTSYSMNLHRQDVKDSLMWWQENLANNNDVDLYLSDVEVDKAKRLEEISSFDIDKQLFFGTLQTEDMLNQFDRLRGNDDYSAILVITDEGSYELSEDKQKIPEMNAPLWMIHLGGNFPQAYNDAVLQAIQGTNGGVADKVATVIKRLATAQADGTSIVDGYSWNIVKDTSTDNSTDNAVEKDDIEPITARQLVYYMSQRGNQPLSVPQLDSIHEVAKDYAIVTPYSSMIVLVNDEQREQLKAAEAREDRFDREVEKGFEDLDTPFSPMESEVSGVPEPDLWILFTIVIIALGIVFYRQRQGNLVD